MVSDTEEPFAVEIVFLPFECVGADAAYAEQGQNKIDNSVLHNFYLYASFCS